MNAKGEIIVLTARQLKLIFISLIAALILMSAGIVHQEQKQEEWFGLRFANFCYEHCVLTPAHHDWEQFIKEGPGYYNTHVKQAQEDYNKLKNKP